jgi:hypothetical protein
MTISKANISIQTSVLPIRKTEIMADQNIPLGWDKRINSMSERDMLLGGAAATKFANKSIASNAYGDDTTGSYKSSDAVREFYMKRLDGTSTITTEPQSPAGGGDNHKAIASLPPLWQERQKTQELQAQQYGGFTGTSSNDKPSVNGSDSQGPEVALLRVGTYTLEALANTLEQQTVKFPMEERAAFAKAVKRVMDAMAKST